MLRVENLSFSYGGQPVLDDISFEIKTGKITTVLGANGCGKSTLFSLLTKNLSPNSGNIYLGEQDISQMKLKHFAQQVSIVHQHNTAPPDITIKKLISYGRIPHTKKFQALTKEDDKIIEWALEATDLHSFKDKQVAQLSGGQRQRAWIAMALAQNTKTLLLDEPTTFLDVRYQIEILNLIKNLNEEYGITIIMVLHDINHALGFGDEIIGLEGGKIIANGTPEKVITSEIIEKLYGINLKIIDVDGKKFVLNNL